MVNSWWNRPRGAARLPFTLSVHSPGDATTFAWTFPARMDGRRAQTPVAQGWRIRAFTV